VNAGIPERRIIVGKMAWLQELSFYLLRPSNYTSMYVTWQVDSQWVELLQCTLGSDWCRTSQECLPSLLFLVTLHLYTRWGNIIDFSTPVWEDYTCHGACPNATLMSYKFVPNTKIS
jgi:hypothetical protein